MTSNPLSVGAGQMLPSLEYVASEQFNSRDFSKSTAELNIDTLLERLGRENKSGPGYDVTDTRDTASPTGTIAGHISSRLDDLSATHGRRSSRRMSPGVGETFSIGRVDRSPRNNQDRAGHFTRSMSFT